MRALSSLFGTIVRGFAIAGIAVGAVAESTQRAHAQSSSAPPIAFEYYHPGLDHYFLTASPVEISALNSGQFSAWVPTGLSFPVLAANSVEGGATPVCRFYGNPNAGLDSHFYSASPGECTDVLKKFPQAWLLESDNLFKVYAADPATGACPAATKRIHRLFNQRADANHRYTDNEAIASDMRLKGYVSEGYGADAIPTAFCVPISSPEVGCQIVASNPRPTVGTSVTFTATCSGSPTSYAWIGCTGTENTCTATSTGTGARAYVLTAASEERAGSPAVVSVVWQPADPNANPANPNPVACSIVASTTNPAVNTNVTLSASCSGNPTTFQWSGCSSTTSSCVAQSSLAGAMTYSVTASNGAAPMQSSIILNWKAVGAAIACSVVTGNAQPAVNTNVTISASCTGNPTSYSWTGCSSTSSSCIATSAVPGFANYSVVAQNAGATSVAASVGVTWQSIAQPRPACTLAASSTTPAVNSNLTLTASCTASPASYTWTGCVGSGASCTTTSSTSGTRSYSVLAHNVAGSSAAAGVAVNWTTAAPPPPVTPGLAYVILPGDPAGYSAGWTRMLYSPNLGKFVIFGGDSHNAAGNNSVRYFDARAKVWTVALPNTNGASGLLNRDNGAVFLNSKRGELIALEGAVKGNGVFDLNARNWSVLDAASGRTDTAARYIKDFDKYVYAEDPAHTYSPAEDTFVVFAGNRRPSLHLFVPNPAGPQPYRLLQHVIRWGTFFPMGDNLPNPNVPASTAEDWWSPSAPNGVDQMENSGVAVGSSMYWMQNLQVGVSVCGTKLETVDAQGKWAGSYVHNTDELWRLDIPATVANVSKPAFEFLGRNPLPDGIKIVGGKWVSAYDPARQLYVMVKGRQINVYSLPRKLWWGGIVADSGVGDNAVGDIDPVADLLVVRWHDGAPSNNSVKALDLRKLDALVATTGTPPVMQRHLTPFDADPRIGAQPTCTPARYYYGSSTPPPLSAPSCTVTSSNGSPVVNTNVTLTASCTGNPTSYAWTGCSSASSTCVATSATSGARSYSLSAANAAGTSVPAQVNVTWQGSQSVPSCTVSASNSSPPINVPVTLTAICTGSPTSYAWVGCASSFGSCTATSATPGPVSYSVTARNAMGSSAAAQRVVSWQAVAPPPPIGAGTLTVTATPVSYTGPARVLGSSKHLDFARLGDRWYKMTGDHAKLDANSPVTQGGRQEILSFNALRNDWRQDQPYYIPDPAQAQIAMPDDAFTIVRNDEAWVFISERVVSSAAIAQVPGMAEQVTEQIMAWKPGRGWRKIVQRPSDIRANRAWRGIYDPVKDRFVIPVARNGLVWVLIGGDGTDQTRRTATGAAYVEGDHDFHAAGLAADFSKRLAYAYDHVKSELWSVNLDTLALQKVATLPEAPQGNSPTTKIAWHPGLRTVVIAASKLHAYQVDSGKLTTWTRPDGFINSAGRQVTSSTIFYDPDTQDIMSVGSIDWETGKTSSVYWRLHIQ